MSKHAAPDSRVTVQVAEMRVAGETFAGIGPEMVHVTIQSGLRWSISMRIDPRTGDIHALDQYPAPAHWSAEVIAARVRS